MTVQKWTTIRYGDADAPNKLALATCTLGLIRVEREVIFLGTGMPLGQAKGSVFVVGFGIQDARNVAWAIAGAQGWEYFMFWDDDVVPLAFGAVETMLETMEQNPEIDILGGVYPARQGIAAPIVLTEKQGSPWWGWEDGGVHPVWMTGTGFTMYRMASIKKLPGPVKVLHTHDGRELTIREYFRLEDGTDDYAMAEEAERAGLRWYVHGGVVCNQIEPTGEMFDVQKARQRVAKNGAERNGSNHNSTNSAGRNGRGQTGVRPRGRRRPADVRAR